MKKILLIIPILFGLLIPNPSQAATTSAEYWSSNGTSDVLQLPSTTFTDIELTTQMDAKSTSSQRFFDFNLTLSGGSVDLNTSNKITRANATVSKISIDDVLFSDTDLLNYVYDNKKHKIKITLTGGVKTGQPFIFANNSKNNYFVKGKIYEIKVFNGANVVSDYIIENGAFKTVIGTGSIIKTGGTFGIEETTPPPPSPPSDLTGLKVDSITDTSISLSWNSSTNATSYDISYSGGTKNETTTSTTITGLSSGTSYTFTVIPKGEGGSGGVGTIQATTTTPIDTGGTGGTGGGTGDTGTTPSDGGTGSGGSTTSGVSSQQFQEVIDILNYFQTGFYLLLVVGFLYVVIKFFRNAFYTYFR